MFSSLPKTYFTHIWQIYQRNKLQRRECSILEVWIITLTMWNSWTRTTTCQRYPGATRRKWRIITMSFVHTARRRCTTAAIWGGWCIAVIWKKKQSARLVIVTKLLVAFIERSTEITQSSQTLDWMRKISQRQSSKTTFPTIDDISRLLYCHLLESFEKIISPPCEMMITFV